MQTTLPFHRFVARSDAFRAADLSTSWVDQHWDGDAALEEALRKALLAVGLASVADEPGVAGVVTASAADGHPALPPARNDWRAAGRREGGDRWTS